jgi:hypothetical protein
MSDPLRRKVTWFRNNLNLLIEDIELEKEKLSVNLYFDTLEVTHMVMGVQSFFRPAHLMLKEFSKHLRKGIER